MATIRELMQGLSDNRDHIKNKLNQMGIDVGDGKFRDIADAMVKVIVDTETTEYKLGKGAIIRLRPGYYHANDVMVSTSTNNKHFTGHESFNVTDQVRFKYTIDSIAQEAEGIGSGYKISMDPITLTAPDSYKITNITVVEHPLASKGETPTITIAEDGLTATIKYDGWMTEPGEGVATWGIMDFSYVIETRDGATGTPVVPTEDTQHIYADDETVMTALTIAPIPIDDDVTANISDIVTDSTGADTYYEAKTAEGEYMTCARVQKVVIDGATVEYDELYNGTTDTLLVKASDLSYNGIDEVSIPRPTLATIPEPVDILSLGFENGEAVVTTGYVPEDSSIVIKNKELYMELEAL